MAASPSAPRRSAGWSALPTARSSPAISGASAGPSSWPTPCRTGSRPPRVFPAARCCEAIRVGQAHGYQLEQILHLEPETIARAGEGDEAAVKAYDAQRFADGKKTASEQRPSMGQDMQKGRRTEIEFINGHIVREGEKLGMTCRANAILTDIVKKVERGELKQDPRHITELRLN